jgi:hypothetical protein
MAGTLANIAAVSSGRRLRAAFQAIAVLALLVAGQGIGVAQDEAQSRVSVWHISSCHLGSPRRYEPDLEIRKYDNGWERSSLEEFQAGSSPDQITCIFVHAARALDDATFSRSFELYHSMARRSDAPVRLVIWSWPTPRSLCVVRDFRISYGVLDYHAYYLGWFLSQLPENERVSLIGFSMGAGVICGAAHVVAGGSLAGCSLPESRGPSQLHVVLWSAAFDNHWLMSGHHYGRAMSRIGELFMLVNRLDPVLKRYHLVQACGRASAAGYTGIAGLARMGEYRSLITQMDGSRWLGRHHDFDRHIHSSRILGYSLETLLWESSNENL